MTISTNVPVFIDGNRHEVVPEQTGSSLKALGGVSPGALLVLQRSGQEEPIDDEQRVLLRPADQLRGLMCDERPVHIFINRKHYRLEERQQTGQSLKELAGIPLTDVLFLQRPHEDLVIQNEQEVCLKNGDRLHSSPPANYGDGSNLKIDA